MAMSFEKIVMLFTMQEPYYGILLSSMERIETKQIPTLGVTRRGNVFKLMYNPDFVGQFNVDTVMQLLKHEVLHVAFNHFSIWNGEDKSDSDEMAFVRNTACDLEINCYLDRSKIQKEAGGVFAEDMGFDKNLGSREYFKLLTKPQEQKAKADVPEQPCNGGQGGGLASPNSSPSQCTQKEAEQAKENIEKNGKPSFDDHSMWSEIDSDAAETLSQVIEDMLVFAAEEVEKGRGTIPGELAGRINVIRNKKKPKPVADWKRYFRRYLGNEFSEVIRKSKKRESKRFPDAAGNKHRRKSHILVAIDTSGSVSMPEYREFFGQLSTLRSTATFHVLECDARIQHEYEFRGRPNEHLHGGGGTSFQPPVDYFNKNRRIYDALVYFTDGEAPVPHDTPSDTLWVISSKGDQSDRKRYRVNGAKVAFIPKKQEN